MKLSTTVIALAVSSTSAAFAPNQQRSSFGTTTTTSVKKNPIVLNGYLDDLNSELYKEDATPDEVADSRQANEMKKDQVDRFGPGNLNDYVDFEEFDGGDGQMGVAGDGQKGLDKSDFQTSSLAKNLNNSRSMSAKNAWGEGTGYAEVLVREKGMDQARAQQLENWHQQREIKAVQDGRRAMTEQYDTQQENAEADWRTLAKFGVERNQEFDLNDAFGDVSLEGGDMEGTIEVNIRPGGFGYKEFSLKNPYMGFADFRASFAPGTTAEWSIKPNEGSLTQREETQFQVNFRPAAMGTSEGYLIIETEDFKKVWKLIGSTG